MFKEEYRKPNTVKDNTKTSKIECLEDKENFEGQRVLVIGGPDAHGVSMAVTSAKYLEKRGAEAIILVGSPVIREGKDATHPGAFYSKTIPELNVDNYDRVVVVDIPLDFKDLENSEKAIIDLDKKVEESRGKRGLPKIEHSTFYLDHHSTTAFSNSSESIIVKNVPKAEDCKLGNEATKIARIGAICDRDVATLPTTEEEMILARGLDSAVRPDPNYQKPKLSKNCTEEEKQIYQEELKKWENNAQLRLEETVKKLKSEDWEYFKNESEKMSKIEIPTVSGFGKMIIVDTQDLTGKFAVMKTMEMAVENSSIEKTPYAIGVLRDLGDTKMGREPSDVVTIIRHWTREDLPSVNKIIVDHFGKEFIEKNKIYGAENAKTMRLPVNDRETAKISANFVEAFAGLEMPDFREIKSVVMCGDPNSGKSVYSTIFREALKNLGVKVLHLDLDKAAPTPQWYLDAEVAYKEAEFLFSEGKLSNEKLEEAKQNLKEMAEKRIQMKRPWSIDLAEEGKQELQTAMENKENDFIIGDIGGGKIKKDESGKIVKITRLTAENAKILEGTDAVIIVSNNQQGAMEWKKLVESGIDPETGVKINREKPIKIIGMYQSILEGNIQETDMGEKIGIITNLDRSKAEKKYNPAIFTTAMFVSEAVEKRKINFHLLAEQARNPYQGELRQMSNEYNEELRKVLPEGTVVDLEGSLLSNTALRGHNDIDLRVLLPKEYTTEEKIREISNNINHIIPFQKIKHIGLKNDQFSVMHQLNLEKEGIEGGIEIEVNVRPADGNVGFAKFQNDFPKEVLDQYVVFKDKTKNDKPRYKKIKEQFYAMTRWLYSQKYWDEKNIIIGSPEILKEAIKIFWDDDLEKVISKPQPEI